jgi:hypothetical protein
MACDTVLLIHAENQDLSGAAFDVQSQLQDTGAFSRIDIFNATFATPTTAQLAAYHAVLVYSDRAFSDAVLLGDCLASFHERGGGVVVATFANAKANNYFRIGQTLRLGGAYGEAKNGYTLLDYNSGGSIYPMDSMGDILEPSSPLLTGVTSLYLYDGWRSTASVISSRAVVVARWRGGGKEPLVLCGQRGNRTLVELNFFPPPASRRGFLSYGWTGHGAALLRNALKYSRCMYRGQGEALGAG